jgi:hypothetical protein
MVKVKSGDSSRLLQLVSDFKDAFTSDGKIIFCQACGKYIVAQQHSHVKQHLSGSKHIAAIVHLKYRPGKQCVIGESSAAISSSEHSKFASLETDLCKAFVAAEIQLFKINNPEVRNFYTQTDPPDVSTLRENYLPSCYEEKLSKIRVF